MNDIYSVVIYAVRDGDSDGVLFSEDLDIYSIATSTKEETLELFNQILKMLKIERPKNESNSNINNNRTI